MKTRRYTGRSVRRMDMKQINEKLELVIHKLMNLDAPDREAINALARMPLVSVLV